MVELIVLLLGVIPAALRSRRDLVLESLLLHHRLAVAARLKRRPRQRMRDRVLWLLGRRFCSDWRRHLVLVTPDTVVRWHRQGWRLFWRRRSRSSGGRPRLSVETRELIRSMSRDNLLWGTERIRGELLKRGIVVSNRSIRRYRWHGPDRPPSQSWRTFLANHGPSIWAAHLLTVQTLTFRTLYVLLFVEHGRRELVHIAATAHRTATWVWRQLINATPWGRTRAYLLRDRDAVYGADFARRPTDWASGRYSRPCGRPARTRSRSGSWGTLRRECLDHVIVVNERHLRAILSDFARTRRWGWTPHDPWTAHQLAQSAPGRCSVGSITRASGQPDHGRGLAGAQRFCGQLRKGGALCVVGWRPDGDLFWPQGPLIPISGSACLYELGVSFALQGDAQAEVFLYVVEANGAVTEQWRRGAKENRGVIPPFVRPVLPDGVAVLHEAISVRVTAAPAPTRQPGLAQTNPVRTGDGAK
jgi:hypothetical protein